MNHTASLTNAQRAEKFATEVRSHLSDLPTEELDDLLDGLGADLAERLEDGGELGDAGQYAEELRQAAGLPPRAPSELPQVTFADRVAQARERSAQWLDESPARRGFRDFAISVRPVWWVLRAVIGAWAALTVIGHPLVNGLPVSYTAMVFTLALIVLSVQWGRGKWLPTAWLRVARTAANVAAVLLLIPFLFANWANLGSVNVDYSYEDDMAFQGLSLNGGEVTNIFAYDCEGNPLDSVRLYDQNGEPITTMGEDATTPPDSWDDEAGTNLVHSFNPLAADAEAWNVFPLSAGAYSELTGEPEEVKPAAPKREQLPPLARDCAAAAEGTDAAADGEAPKASEDAKQQSEGQRQTADATPTKATDAP